MVEISAVTWDIHLQKVGVPQYVNRKQERRREEERRRGRKKGAETIDHGSLICKAARMPFPGQERRKNSQTCASCVILVDSRSANISPTQHHDFIEPCHHSWCKEMRKTYSQCREQTFNATLPESAEQKPFWFKLCINSRRWRVVEVPQETGRLKKG